MKVKAQVVAVGMVGVAAAVAWYAGTAAVAVPPPVLVTDPGEAFVAHYLDPLDCEVWVAGYTVDDGWAALELVTLTDPAVVYARGVAARTGEVPGRVEAVEAVRAALAGHRTCLPATYGWTAGWDEPPPVVVGNP